jgi:hypothetical protein
MKKAEVENLVTLSLDLLVNLDSLRIGGCFRLKNSCSEQNSLLVEVVVNTEQATVQSSPIP